jgi:hypothetical protein
VFGFRRKTRGQLVKAELGESYDHLMRAATHAAGGVGAAVGPRMSAARGYVGPPTTKARDMASQSWEQAMGTLAPLVAAANDGARQSQAKARKMKARNMKKLKKQSRASSSTRWPVVAILVTGAAVGAAGAVAMRRRRQNQWDEYDPSIPLESTAPGTSATSMSDRTPDNDGDAKDELRSTADQAKDSMGSAGRSFSDGAKDAATRAEEKADQLRDTSSRNSRG